MLMERIEPLKREKYHGFMKKGNCRRCAKPFIKTSKWHRICKSCNVRDSEEYKRLRRLHKWKVNKK